MMTASSPKILIVGPAWVGDMVIAQSLFKLIKQLYPKAQIDVLAPNWTLPLLSRMPEVNRPISAPLFHQKLQLKLRLRIAKLLKKEKYDQAIVLPSSWKSALIPFLARIPKRTGWIGEFRFGLLNDARKLNKERYLSMTDRFCALALPKNSPLPELLKPKLEVSLKQREVLLKKLKLKITQPLLILCPGAEGGPAKQWPPLYYATVAAEKLKEGWQIWILGTTKEQAIAASIQKICSNQCVDLTGKTTLEEAIDLISLASRVVSNDSGLMHIAASLDRPVIVIYGATSSTFTPPLSKKGIKLSLGLSCQPCHKKVCPLGHTKCMWDLKPTEVLNQMKIETSD